MIGSAKIEFCNGSPIMANQAYHHNEYQVAASGTPWRAADGTNGFCPMALIVRWDGDGISYYWPSKLFLVADRARAFAVGAAYDLIKRGKVPV
jgi:hypothetical protein